MILPTTQANRWLLYALVLLIVLYAVLCVLWKVAPGQLSRALVLISPFHIWMPPISGTVVDAMTGKPLPGLDVCLLATVNDNFVEHHTKVKRSETTRTDSSGMFSFDRWNDILDLTEKWDGYGIAVTDPAARWKQKCGSDEFLFGGETDVLQRELDLESQEPLSEENQHLPYFPVALVIDPNFPHPLAYRQGHLAWFPSGTLIRKIDDPRNLRIPVIPLVLDERQCRSAPDSNSADLCRVMNESYTADDLRKILTSSSVGR